RHSNGSPPISPSGDPVLDSRSTMEPLTTNLHLLCSVPSAERQLGKLPPLVSWARTRDDHWTNFAYATNDAFKGSRRKHRLDQAQRLAEAVLPGKVRSRGKGQGGVTIGFADERLRPSDLIQVVHDNTVQRPGDGGCVPQQRQVQPAAAQAALPPVPRVARIL